ncbi:MAG TPA: hypothetical protein VKW77_08285 [Acidimicrobiales bacterium]|nr:hypothetical protein [Acidimicrobiales bacterium]
MTEGRRRPERRQPFPFWVLQAAELAVALVLVDVAVHVERPSLLLGSAGALALLALLSDGPLGLVRLLGPRRHVLSCVVLCAAIAGLFVAGIALPSLRPGAAGIVVGLVAAVGLARLATLTRTAPPIPAGSWPAPVIDANAVEVATARPGPAGAAYAPHQAHQAQQAHPPQSAASDPADPADPAAGASAEGAQASTDRLARRAGEAVAAGRSAARRHRPAVESQARRGIRSLGRAVGRLGR